MTTSGAEFTVKEIVIEIRDTVKSLDAKVDRIDREGALGTREQMAENARTGRINGERLAALERWQTGLSAVAGLKKAQLVVLIGLTPLLVAFLTSYLTYYWINHG
jgi:hypothetical protein